MDNASAYGAEDCRFDPCLDRFFLSNIVSKYQVSNFNYCLKLSVNHYPQILKKFLLICSHYLQ